MAESRAPSAVNALARARSPYLRSAMHQPVEWREWGEEAFAAARSRNQPVLLDIGAVWCHWCHVMDRESYENPEIARAINENFIPIKVDRDERPDVDSRYQAAVSALSGQGGWPLTAFLTGEGKPFYGGTYFPPDDRYGRPGFKRVLAALAEAYRAQPGEVAEQAEKVMAAISRAESFATRAQFSPAAVGAIAQAAAALFDPEHGGFGSRPKFPHPAVMDLLIHRFSRAPENAPEKSRLRQIITVTLRKMAGGGVYDQLAGGFHRYSVDERWIVPHFEKMSYDNAGLLLNYVHAWQATGDHLFAAIAKDIIRWMDEWLSDRARGGFYGSQDADISLPDLHPPDVHPPDVHNPDVHNPDVHNQDDGDYFTWTVAEAAACLGEDEFKIAALHYDIGEIGEMSHDPARNVLYIRADLAELSRRLGRPEAEVASRLRTAKSKMYAARRLRPAPYIDKTVYVNWNALCVSAYLEAARVLKVPAARAFALRSLDRLLAAGCSRQRGLRHVIAYPEALGTAAAVPGKDAIEMPLSGMLDDYAFTVNACLDAYYATANLKYFVFARDLAEAMLERFYDRAGGGFFDREPSSAELGALSAPRKPFQDSPTPAANPAAAIALLRLHALTHHAGYLQNAKATLEVFAAAAERYGIFAGAYGIAAALLSQPHTQVVIIAATESDAETDAGADIAADPPATALEHAALSTFELGRSVLRLPASAATRENLPPALAQTLPNLPAVRAGKSSAIVCANFACRPPIEDPDELRRVLADTSLSS